MTGAYPAEWLEQMRRDLGDDFPAFERALSERPAAGLRVNPLREEQAHTALGRYAGEPVPWYPAWGRYLRAEEGLRPGADVAHFAGAYYMQEPSAMAAVAALDPKPGERILDLCAAPGGKSGQIAAAIGCSGALVSNEPNADRARMLAGNLERLGVTNAAVVCAMPDILAKKWPGAFDAVLCDAPCSGEGMFRRDPSSRDEWTPRSAEGCAARQKTILTEAAKLVAPGGRLVYSTCTFHRAENEENVRWLTETRPEFVTEDFLLPGVGRSGDGCLRLWPHSVRGEGHFVALLRRNRPAKAAVRDRRKRGERDMTEARGARDALTKTALRAFPDRFAEYRPELLGDRLFLTPGAMPDTAGVYCLRRGLPACRVGASHVEPDHSLAMALLPGEARAEYALTDGQIEAWLRGEPVEAALSKDVRWVWTHSNGLPLGWGKHSDGAVKNHLPKGLWRR